MKETISLKDYKGGHARRTQRMPLNLNNTIHKWN